MAVGILLCLRCLAFAFLSSFFFSSFPFSTFFSLLLFLLFFLFHSFVLFSVFLPILRASVFITASSSCGWILCFVFLFFVFFLSATPPPWLSAGLRVCEPAVARSLAYSLTRCYANPPFPPFELIWLWFVLVCFFSSYAVPKISVFGCNSYDYSMNVCMWCLVHTYADVILIFHALRLHEVFQLYSLKREGGVH